MLNTLSATGSSSPTSESTSQESSERETQTLEGLLPTGFLVERGTFSYPPFPRDSRAGDTKIREVAYQILTAQSSYRST